MFAFESMTDDGRTLCSGELQMKLEGQNGIGNVEGVFSYGYCWGSCSIL